jgi:hypothetical protein
MGGSAVSSAKEKVNLWRNIQNLLKKITSFSNFKSLKITTNYRFDLIPMYTNFFFKLILFLMQDPLISILFLNRTELI